MKNTYFELIDQTYYFPQEGFDLNGDYLNFNGIDLRELIQEHGTPLRLTFLPKIRQQIKKARAVFGDAIEQQNYNGSYEFCYCTKCSHFYQVINTALKENVSLETSSSFDIDLIENLFKKGKIDSSIKIVHNGYKTDNYLQKIIKLQKKGFNNTVIVLDNMEELDRLEALDVEKPLKIGLRICIDEEPKAHYYTSRMGINKYKIVDFAADKIAGNDHFTLEMIHFFVDSGIADTFYYWGEFQKALNLYVKIKQIIPSLNALNIGGGFPIRNRLDSEYDYAYMGSEIIRNIKETCDEAHVDHPDIYTEFGKYTVGESGAVIFKVLQQKQQNHSELWYIIDNSLMNTIPDTWSIDEKFILLPLNKWNNKYRRVNIGGISCDHSDYYNSELQNQPILLPEYASDDEEPLYLGFFHTGAYQEAISGYGGIKHCLIPSPKHVVIDFNSEGELKDYTYRNEQSVDNMLHILGYNDG